MKFTFKKRNMRQSIENWWDEYKEARRQRQLRKIEKLEGWHEAYAWYPMKLTTDRDSVQFAWLTKVQQKYSARREVSSFFVWNVVHKNLKDRHTAKDFFKLKLKGKIKDDSEFVEMEHDGTNTNINVTNTKPGSTVYVKKGSPKDHISMWG